MLLSIHAPTSTSIYLNLRWSWAWVINYTAQKIQDVTVHPSANPTQTMLVKVAPEDISHCWLPANPPSNITAEICYNQPVDITLETWSFQYCHGNDVYCPQSYMFIARSFLLTYGP